VLLLSGVPYIWNTLRQLNTQPAGRTFTKPAVARRASRQ